MKVLSGDYSKIQRSNYFTLKSDTKSIVEYKQSMQIAAGGTAGYPIYLSSVYFCGALISQSPNENFCTIIQQPPRLCSDRSHVICRSKAKVFSTPVIKRLAHYQARLKHMIKMFIQDIYSALAELDLCSVLRLLSFYHL